jgi:hypothetical protein
MNISAWLLVISLMVTLLHQGNTFHRSLVCRQKAWLKSTEDITRFLLSEKSLPSAPMTCTHRPLRSYRLQLNLKGKL